VVETVNLGPVVHAIHPYLLALDTRSAEDRRCRTPRVGCSGFDRRQVFSIQPPSTGPITQRAQDLLRELEPWRGTPAVEDLRERFVAS